MHDTDKRMTAVTKQARLLFNALARKHHMDELHKACVDDLVLDIYQTEHRRDMALDEALTDIIEVKRLEHAPVNAHAVALANLRYEDAI